VVGIAKITKEAFQDPTTTEDWTAVELVPVKALKKPVTLADVKKDKSLKRNDSRKDIAPECAAREGGGVRARSGDGWLIVQRRENSRLTTLDSRLIYPYIR